MEHFLLEEKEVEGVAATSRPKPSTHDSPNAFELPLRLKLELPKFDRDMLKWSEF